MSVLVRMRKSLNKFLESSTATVFEVRGGLVPTGVALLVVGSLQACGSEAGTGDQDVTAAAATAKTELVSSDFAMTSHGDENSCGIRKNGELWCWGKNVNGEVGAGDQLPHLAPVHVGDSARTWMDVSVGLSHSCAVDSDGDLWCWGSNSSSALGFATGEPTMSVVWAPLWLGNEKTYVDVEVAASGKFSCAIASDGTADCWGDNQHGFLGVGSDQDSVAEPMPLISADGGGWVQIALGGFDSRSFGCGVSDLGNLHCWGANDAAQLGLGRQDDEEFGETIPTVVMESGDIVSVAAGISSACAIDEAGQLWCWGSDDPEALGLKAGFDGMVPTLVAQSRGYEWESVSVGAGGVSGIQRDGTLWAWGTNEFGELGLGYEENAVERKTLLKAEIGSVVTEPEQVGAYGGWASVDRATTSACALKKATGKLYCWGDNDEGQLGLASTKAAIVTMPTEVKLTVPVAAGTTPPAEEEAPKEEGTAGIGSGAGAGTGNVANSGNTDTAGTGASDGSTPGSTTPVTTTPGAGSTGSGAPPSGSTAGSGTPGTEAPAAEEPATTTTLVPKKKGCTVSAEGPSSGDKQSSAVGFASLMLGALLTRRRRS